MSDELYRSIVAGGKGAEDVYYRLILEQAKKVVHGRGAPADGIAWHEEDEHEMANEFWASGKHQSLLLTAVDDDSLRALLFSALRNRVLDERRRSERGRLRRRIVEILRGGPYTEEPRYFWRRDGSPQAAFGGREAELLKAVWSVEVSVVRWSPSAQRSSPHADRDSFLRLLDALFLAANGAVELDVLVRVIGQRLGVGPTPWIGSLDAPD